MSYIFIHAVLVSVVAVDDTKFRSCMTTPFCARFRKWTSSSSRSVVEIVGDPTSSMDSGITSIDLVLKSSLEDDSNYRLGIILYPGSIRVSVGDARAGQSRGRYRVPEHDVIDFRMLENEIITPEVTSSKTNITVLVKDMYTVIIMRSPMSIQIYNKFGVLIQYVNQRSFFAFEKYRDHEGQSCVSGTDPACAEGSDASGSWRDEFGGFLDEKSNGPSAVGIDHDFVNCSRVYGLPERTTPFLLPTNGPEYRLFNLDVKDYELHSHSGLYGSIPFLMARHSTKEPATSGFLWLNPSDTFVKLKNHHKSQTISSYWISETGVMDMIVFVGPSPTDVLAQYHRLTGMPSMPPLFALGYHQSKWGYRNQAQVEEISQNFHLNEISCEVIWLDIQHTNGNRYFTWHPSNFPNPEAMLKSLETRGHKLVAIVDPHMKVDDRYVIYTDFLRQKFFVSSNKFSDSDFVGECWPGPSSYPDFTRSDVRAYWASLFAYSRYTGSSPNLWIWNDMNEPSVFSGPEKTLPKSTIHSGGIEHREVHNLYGMYYHRATFEGLLSRDASSGKSPRRPFVLSRSFFAGSHRYGPIWTGDNTAQWLYLKASIPMHLSLAMSGMSFVGSDVGGFFGNPSVELYIRWQQAGASSYPFFRCHSEITTKNREPWEFGPETMRIVRNAIDFRYKLLPYWYTLFSRYALEGLPVIRPIWFHDDRNDEVVDEFAERQIMVGDSLLIQPIVQENAQSIDVFFPNSKTTCSKWYPFPGTSDFGPAAVFESGSIVRNLPVNLETIPVFVRAGSIIPMKKTKRASTSTMKQDPYTFLIALDDEGRASGELYIDDEETMEYITEKKFARFQLFYDGEFSYNQLDGDLKIDSIPIAGLEFIHPDGSSERFSDVLPRVELSYFGKTKFVRYKHRHNHITVCVLKVSETPTSDHAQVVL